MSGEENTLAERSLNRSNRLSRLDLAVYGISGLLYAAVLYLIIDQFIALS